MSERYLKYLFEQFKIANGIKDNVVMKEVEQEFAKWIMQRQDSIKSYIELFEYMEIQDEMPVELIAEFGKGALDSVTYNLANKCYDTIAITRFADTFKLEDGVLAYNGYLCRDNEDNVFVNYPTKEELACLPNCNDLLNWDIQTLFTQLPLTSADLAPFMPLVGTDRTLFIGTYGNSKDKDRDTNLKRIQDLYVELYGCTYREVFLQRGTIEDSYVSAIKIASKQKILRKVLTR